MTFCLKSKATSQGRLTGQGKSARQRKLASQRRLQRSLSGWLLLMSSLMCAHGDQTNDSFVINPTRAYGYYLGDVIEQRVSLHQDNVIHSLQQLPSVQREGRWVARNSVSVSADGQWLDMRYQIINAAPETRTISLPALSLESDASTGIEVPAWSFTISPLLPAADHTGRHKLTHWPLPSQSCSRTGSHPNPLPIRSSIACCFFLPRFALCCCCG